MIKPVISSYFPKERYSMREEMETIQKDLIRLKALLSQMEIPATRKNISYDNLCWLSVNLPKNNANKARFNATINLVRKLMRKKHLFLHEKSTKKR